MKFEREHSHLPLRIVKKPQRFFYTTLVVERAAARLMEQKLRFPFPP
jgi:hypothetical protein